MERLIRGGVYLARLDPAKGAEIGKLRPVALLSAPEILEVDSPLLFVCPLSSQSDPRFASLHVALPPRDDLKVASFALAEHCRAISRARLCGPLIAVSPSPRSRSSCAVSCVSSACSDRSVLVRDADAWPRADLPLRNPLGARTAAHSPRHKMQP